MKKRNLLLFLNAFYDGGRGMTGGDQMLIQIFGRIRRHFAEMRCYTNINGKKAISSQIKNIKFLTSCNLFERFNIFLNYLLRTIKAFSCLQQKNIDIIYSGSDFFPDVVPSFLYKLLHQKTKWVQCVFHIYPHWQERPGNKIKNFIAQYLQKFSFLLIQKADLVININKKTKNHLAKTGINRDKIFINYPGIDFDYLKKIRPSFKTKKYQGSFLGRLTSSKGIFDLIKIWKLVTLKFPDYKLAIIGGGNPKIRRKLEEEINKAGLKNQINVLGFLENNDSFSIIKKSDFFIFPSHEEGFGIAIAEAMACGVPVIAWNLPIYNETFQRYIFKIKENDIKAMAEKIIYLSENELIRKDKIQKGIKFIQRYSWDYVAKRELKILNLLSQ